MNVQIPIDKQVRVSTLLITRNLINFPLKGRLAKFGIVGVYYGRNMEWQSMVGVWHGMIWHGMNMEWHGMVWVWYGMAWHDRGMAWYGIVGVRYGMAWH